jgi:curved DNA-binding protein CbpA
MRDAFILLEEPRRPWLDPEALKQKFLRQSQVWHPDRFAREPLGQQEEANRRYAELNQAYRILSEPKDRLHHLLELEMGTSPKDIQRIPPGTMDLFVEVGQTCRDCDSFLESSPSSDSPMLQLQRMRSVGEWSLRLQRLQQTIDQLRVQTLNRVRELDDVWERAPIGPHEVRLQKLPLADLEQVYRSLSYISRWTSQVQERLVLLAS